MRVAMYLRLSSEDGDLKDTGKAESESISNQRGLLQNFISSQPDFSGWEVSEFCDDGWSGKNFERPSFLRMMEQVRQGQIHCIVVKDLSRFGRDYLVVGNYISRVFPFLGVRFIAVNDSFDSSRPQDIDSLDTSFKTLIYDLYSRELSAKVKNAKRMRAEKGLFLSPFAPYGYVKDPENKNRLLIDEEAAAIVRRIFALTIDGAKPSEIAAMLNREGVPTPMLYKRAAGCSRDRWPSIHEENFWTVGNICKILRDERYIGKCVYGKRERDMVGNWHTVKRSKSDWVVVDETHEGIVSKADFQKAAGRMREYKEFVPSVSERNPLRKKVICGTCGYAMPLSNTKNAKYHCRTSHLETGFGCTSEGILQADIHEMVVTLIRTYAAYAVSLEHLLLLQKERIQAERKQARRELAVLQSRKNQLEKGLQDLYEKLIDGAIDKETYLSHKASNQAKAQEISEQMERLEKSSQAATEQGGAFIEKYREYTELENLTAEVANDVVKRVTVYKDGGIEIELALRDELEKLLACIEAVDAAS